MVAPRLEIVENNDILWIGYNYHKINNFDEINFDPAPG